MCGFAAVVGPGASEERAAAMIATLHHRGPDATATHAEPGRVALAHARLKIIDLSNDANQPMSSPDGQVHLVYNGEVYNYRELRDQLSDYAFRTTSDSEVVLASYLKWGRVCLDRFVGMFAFAIWDQRTGELWVARDRFGVKPVYYARLADGSWAVASEIKALHAASVPIEHDRQAWASYLVHGLHDHDDRTFWAGIRKLPPGHQLTIAGGEPAISRWYDLGARLRDQPISERDAEEAYLELLLDAVRLRFRSDVPVGLNVSGGLDSALLLAMVDQVFAGGASLAAFTFATGDDAYDETPWVETLLRGSRHSWTVCQLSPEQVPDLAARIYQVEDEPFGGLPTLAYANCFAAARARGVHVLLDGQGMDEQWAGYDYYARYLGSGDAAGTVVPIQGSRSCAIRPECVAPALAELAVQPLARAGNLVDRQIQDATTTKIPRALRFNDRISMAASVELREPFLDHRLFELTIGLPDGYKIRDGVHKWLLRRLAARLLPTELRTAPKRPVQTPQREWLRDPLFEWTSALVDRALAVLGDDWLRPDLVRQELARYRTGAFDNSFFVWQWLSLGLAVDLASSRG